VRVEAKEGAEKDDVSNDDVSKYRTSMSQLDVETKLSLRGEAEKEKKKNK
jgi:hypothetical protein